MEAKLGGNPTPPYEEIEPFCVWQRQEAKDIIVVHLPVEELILHLPGLFQEFTKEQLKVHIKNFGLLKISGERQVDAEKRTKFHKEVSVPKSCIIDDIHAKFARGCLIITMPKTPQEDKLVSKLKRFGNVAAVTIVLSVLSAYFIYKRRSTVED